MWLGTAIEIPSLLSEVKLVPEQIDRVKELLRNYQQERRKLILVTDPTEPMRLLRVTFWNEVDRLLSEHKKCCLKFSS